jgi:hydroxymethylpyrimidine/phosphomethylpyrimidine kinase
MAAGRGWKRFRPTVVSIAGSDSGGGAGIQADVLTLSAHGVWAATVIVAGTAQNTRGVTAVEPFSPRFVARQIDAVFSDLAPMAVKIGMLYDEARVRAVAAGLRRYRARNVVLDPVLAATAGSPLLTRAGLRALRQELLPLCAIVTPNRSEAARLAAMPAAETETDLAAAAGRISELGAPAVLITGGDEPGGRVRDLLWNDGTLRVFDYARIRTRATHGTGCILSSAIAANLALGFDLEPAVERAIRHVRTALRHGVFPGGGAGAPGHRPTSSRTGTHPRSRPSWSSRSAPRRARKRGPGRGSFPSP